MLIYDKPYHLYTATFMGLAVRKHRGATCNFHNICDGGECQITMYDMVDNHQLAVAGVVPKFVILCSYSDGGPNNRLASIVVNDKCELEHNNWFRRGSTSNRKYVYIDHDAQTPLPSDIDELKKMIKNIDYSKLL